MQRRSCLFCRGLTTCMGMEWNKSTNVAPCKLMQGSRSAKWPELRWSSTPDVPLEDPKADTGPADPNATGLIRQCAQRQCDFRGGDAYERTIMESEAQSGAPAPPAELQRPPPPALETGPFVLRPLLQDVPLSAEGTDENIRINCVDYHGKCSHMASSLHVLDQQADCSGA